MSNDHLIVRIGEPALYKEITSHCPHCGYGPLDGCTGTRFANESDVRKDLLMMERPIVPEPGDLGLCGSCAGYQVYERDPAGRLGVRAATDADLDQYRAQADVWELIQKMRGPILARRKPS